jgi:hypothetical protein
MLPRHPFTLLLTVLCLGTPAAAATSAATEGQAVRLPVVFEENVGQSRSGGEYVALAGKGSLSVAPDAVTYRFGAEGQALTMRLVGASPRAEITPERRLPVRSHYFLGADASRWRRDVPGYSEVRARGVYSGIDVVHYTNARQDLEQDFIVAPRADPSRIRMRFEGARSVRLDRQGALVIETSSGKLRQRRPVAYQIRNTRQVSVPCDYRVSGNEVRFALGSFDRSNGLVIDPVLEYGSYFSSDVRSLGVDAAGKLYVAGDVIDGSERSALVAKLDPTLSGSAQLVYRTIFGGSTGSSTESVFDIAVNADQSVWATGSTAAFDFPLTANPFQSSPDGLVNTFLVRLSPAGAVNYSSYITFAGSSAGNGVQPTGSDVFVSGTRFGTLSDFPVVRYGGGGGTGGDAFLIRLTNLGETPDPSPADGYNQTNLVYAAMVGGTAADNGGAVVVDPSGRAYVAGLTTSSDFPVSSNALNAARSAGANDLTLFGLSADGNALVYSSFLVSGDGFNGPPALAIDIDGRLYAAGVTNSSGFPFTTDAFQSTLSGPSDGFLLVLDPLASSSLVYGTLLGGTGADSLTAVAVDATNRIYLGGSSSSADAPKANALDSTLGGTADGYLAILDRTKTGAAQLVFGTYVGGSAFDTVKGIAVASATAVWVSLTPVSTDLATVNPVQTGTGPVFLARINPVGQVGPPGKLKVSPTKLSFPSTRLTKTSKKTLLIQNIGKGPLDVNVGALAAPYSVLSGGGAFTLAPKQKVQVTIQFAPTVAGNLAATLTITSSDPARPTQLVTLKGKAK